MPEFVGGVKLEYPRNATLENADVFLGRRWSGDAPANLDARDLTSALRLDLLTMAQDWLDCQEIASSLRRSRATLETWRPAWWESLGVTARFSSKSLFQSSVSGDRGAVAKYTGVDGYLKQLSGLTQGGAPTSDCRALFIVENATPSMSEGSLRVADCCDQVLIMDPRVSDRYPVANPVRMSNVLRPRLGVRDYEEVDALLDLFDTGFARASRPGMRRLFGYIRRVSDGLERVLGACRPRAIVLASDQHRVGSLAAGLAERKSLPCLVLQHGLPASPTGYLPVRATHIAAIGDSSRKFFGSNAPDADVRVCGLPRGDLPHRSSGGSSLVVTVEPMADQRVRAMMRIAYDVCAGSRGEVSLTARLHPGDKRTLDVGDEALITSWGLPSGSSVRIDRATSSDFCLRDARLLFTYNSTLAVDASRWGVPVVTYGSAEHVQPAYFEGLPVVEDAPSLRAALEDDSQQADSLVLAHGESAIAKVRSYLEEICRT